MRGQVTGVHSYECITATPKFTTFSLEELRFNDMFPGKYQPLAQQVCEPTHPPTRPSTHTPGNHFYFFRLYL